MFQQFELAFPDGASIRPEVLRGAASGRRLYAIFVIARSGSTWLTELARNTGVLGGPQEWLNPNFCLATEQHLGCPPPVHFGTTEINEYILAFIRHSETAGIAGIELSWPQIEALSTRALAGVDFSFLSTCFYLRRRDVVAQSISLYRSAASGFFHSYQTLPYLRNQFQEVEYDADAIAGNMVHLIDCENAFEEMFLSCGLTPIRWFYEDLVAAPAKVIQQMAAGLRTCLDSDNPGSTLMKLADVKNTEWVARFQVDRGDFLAAQLNRRPQMEAEQLSQVDGM